MDGPEDIAPGEPNLARRIMNLLGGSVEAYGTYDPSGGEHVPGMKIEIKSSAKSLRGKVDEERWRNHIEGKVPLGVIPLREDDTVIWGCIDVDKYDINLTALCAAVSRLGLPLTVGRSKSGGAHIFVFLKEPADPKIVQRYLRACAARLGVGGSEIFPKQTSLKRERGDVGNWIIAPYYGSAMPCLRPSGQEYTLIEFLRHAERSRVDLDEIQDPEPERKKRGKPNGPLSDGPPCLEFLTQEGFPDGTRNNALFDLGVYARKKWPDEWQAKIDEFNHKYMLPPLSSEEVLGIIRSLEKKDYVYKCSEVPICNHCNVNLCKTRMYGISDRNDFPMITSLSVLVTEPVIWFVDIDSTFHIDVYTEQLIEYKRFQIVCAERLYQMFPPLPKGVWWEQVHDAMQHVVRIEASPETERHGTLRETIGDYLTNRWRAKRKEELLEYRPWADEENKRIHFHMPTLMKHLKAEGMTGYSQATVVAWVKSQGGNKQGFHFKQGFVNTWWVPFDLFIAPGTIDPPEIDDEEVM